jgi:hypothetical protein
MEPTNDLTVVRALAAAEESCEFYAPVIAELRVVGLDTDDLREIICSELGVMHCFKTKMTEKYYPETFSDYFSVWVSECGCQMFLKLLVAESANGDKRLVITSFKKDSRHVA